jgi:hypothetical protein
MFPAVRYFVRRIAPASDPEHSAHALGRRLAMKGRVIVTVLLVAAAFVPYRAAAQEKTENIKTITGCIQRGEPTYKFKLLAKDGAVWDIDDKSKDLSVSAHLGQIVNVVAKVEPARPEKHPKLNTKRNGLLDVQSITTVSNMCVK